MKVKVSFRRVLLSTGEFTTEAMIDDGFISAYESSPLGLTIGLKEKADQADTIPDDFIISN